MHILAAITGAALIFIVLGDAFETIILPRRVTRKLRLARLFYRWTWMPFRAMVGGIENRKLREGLFGYYGPLSLLVLLGIWAIGMVFAFALLQWATPAKFAGDLGMSEFSTALYFSGTTFFTIGLGDVHPLNGLGRFLSVAEGGTGFGFLALVIGYLPVIYQGFSQRETNISLLDARAGSPPSAAELISRYAHNHALDELEPLLHEWEHWAAELLESHISYPVLAYFRSQHDNQSWLGSLTTILDATALLMVGVEGAPARQAALTFAMARHAVVDLAQVLQQPPIMDAEQRLTRDDLVTVYAMLRADGAHLRSGPAAEERFRELRNMYEPYVLGMAKYLEVFVPHWIPRERRPDNWQTSAWQRAVLNVTTSLEKLDRTDDHV
jgi:Ion channel